MGWSAGLPARTCIAFCAGFFNPIFYFALALSLIAGCAAELLDSDSDGASDAAEIRLGTDPADSDTDGDGVSDGEELVNETSPLLADSDGDGLSDGDDDESNAPVRGQVSISSGNDVEPNDTTREPVFLVAQGNANLTLLGRIDRVADIDVFEIGAIAAGDRFTVDFHRMEGALRPALAILDEADSLIDLVWDRSGPGQPDVPRFLDAIARRSSPRSFLAVARGDGELGTGAYRFDVLVTRGGGAPPPNPQTVFLDFDGGLLDVPLLGIRAIEAFDAGRIARVYDGETEAIKRAITDTCRDNFARFNVFVVTSDEVTAVDRSTVSVLLIGSQNDSAFGVSQAVDSFNEDDCDDGIVFAESFTPAVFGFAPGAEALGVAIGNVASHEAGHLLGLRHVNDPTALMDERSPAINLLRDQKFKIAPLAPSVFPLGLQDDARMLTEVVGARLQP